MLKLEPTEPKQTETWKIQNLPGTPESETAIWKLANEYEVLAKCPTGIINVVTVFLLSVSW